MLIRVALIGTALEPAACSSGTETSPASPPPSVSDPFQNMASPPAPVDVQLPAVVTAEEVGGERIQTTHDADWVIVSGGVAWVTGLEEGLGRFDATTGKPLPGVKVKQGPCGALDEGFGAVWTLTCATPGVAKLDPSGDVAGWVGLSNLATNEGETSLGIDEGAVWVLTDGDDCFSCSVTKVDPGAMQVLESYPIPAGATAVRAGLGGVWVVYYDDDAVVHVDPESGEVVTAIATGQGPRFFDVGEGGVWVMNQVDGSVSHIDPATDSVVATIAVDDTIEGGDLTVGDGLVWLRATDELVAAIDPVTDEVIARIGEPLGSGSASADGGQLWVSAHDRATLYRIPTAGLG